MGYVPVARLVFSWSSWLGERESESCVREGGRREGGREGGEREGRERGRGYGAQRIQICHLQ